MKMNLSKFYKTTLMTTNRLDENDPNDTIDCFSLPEIDIPHEQTCMYPHLPGTAMPTYSITTGLTSNIDLNTSNIKSQLTNLTEPINRPNIIPKKSSEIYSSFVETTRINEKQLIKSYDNIDMNINLSEKNLINQTFNSNEQVNEQSTNEQPTTSLTNPILTNKKLRSTSPYQKYLLNPPKPKSMCSKLITRKQNHKNENDIKSNIDDDNNEEVNISDNDGSNINLPKSIIYINKSSGIVYRLEFTTSDLILTPLYVHPRMSPQLDNEKKIQPNAYEYRSQSIVPNSNIPFMFFVRRKYALSLDEQITNKNKYKYLFPPLKVYTDDLKSMRQRSVSETNKSITNGHIYFLYKNMLLHILCETLPITQIKMPTDEDILQRMEKLNMPSSEFRKNKGIIIARCGYDLLQLTFKMNNINLNRIELKNTAAVQTVDKMVYIREKSQISGRSLLLAIPETTYFYRNPMSTIHRLHLNFQGTNIMPLWKYELMKARLADRRGLSSTENQIEKIFKQTRGTRLYFDGLDSLITVQTGMLCCDISSGQNHYETMMHEEYSHHRNARSHSNINLNRFKTNEQSKLGTDVTKENAPQGSDELEATENPEDNTDSPSKK